MTEVRLTVGEAAALEGALLLPEDELAGRLAEAIDEAAVDATVGEYDRVQDLRDLAALAWASARRLADRGMHDALDDLYPDPNSPADGT